MTATLIIIAASVQLEANAAAKQHFDPVGGDKTFTLGLVTPPATNTVTHYWTADRMEPANRGMLNVMVTKPPFAGNVQVFDYDADADPGFPDRKFAELGLAVYTPPLN